MSSNQSSSQPSSGSTTPVNVPRDLDETIVGNGFIVENDQTVDNGNVTTHTTFDTTAETSDIQIDMDLSANVVSYYDNTGETQTAQLLGEIELYAGKIQCSDFHGKGTIDDYSALFSAAAKIANESKQMELDVDIEGFEEFATAAEDLSKLFQSFILKLENVSIINDTAFLVSVLNALKKIADLSDTFGKFKETILATSSIQIPKSAHQTKVVLENVMGQINCAMTYINHFVDGSNSPAPIVADLSQEEKDIIDNAVSTIDHWNLLCEQGVSIALATHPDIQYITNASNNIKETTSVLKNATNKLKLKLQEYRF
jgi:hypothetical protein